MVDKSAVPFVQSASHAGLLAQAGKPFVVQHSFDRSLSWDTAIDGATALRGCSPARNACWHALLTPDGVVGAYPRDVWSVSHTSQQHVHEGGALASTEHLMAWVPLNGQSPELIASSSRPRHVATPDLDIEQALAYWGGHVDVPEWNAQKGFAPEVYLHGRVDKLQSHTMVRGTIFEELLETCFFGRMPFHVSIYASRKGTQTNLHADQHSGFLVQVVGSKRVVLIGRKQAATLRCPNWGNPEAPVHRRSWYDNGVPDVPGWDSQSPFLGLGAREIEIGPGQALYIPKGVFHDVLSKSPETLGLVLRCSD